MDQPPRGGINRDCDKKRDAPKDFSQCESNTRFILANQSKHHNYIGNGFYDRWMNKRNNT